MLLVKCSLFNFIDSFQFQTTNEHEINVVGKVALCSNIGFASSSGGPKTAVTQLNFYSVRLLLYYIPLSTNTSVDAIDIHLGHIYSENSHKLYFYLLPRSENTPAAVRKLSSLGFYVWNSRKKKQVFCFSDAAHSKFHVVGMYPLRMCRWVDPSTCLSRTKTWGCARPYVKTPPVRHMFHWVKAC